MKKLIGLLAFISFGYHALSQVNVQWEARYNGAGNGMDQAVDVAIDGSGNTYVTGNSWNGSDWDIVTVKYNNLGVEQWNYVHDGGGWDQAYAMDIDASGNVYVTGHQQISGGDIDILMLKINATGASAIATVHTGSSDWDYGNDIVVDNLNGWVYVAAAYMNTPTDKNWRVLKYDKSTAAEIVVGWPKTINGTYSLDEALCITLDGSNNIYAAGYTETAANGLNVRVVRYQPNGTQDWSRTFDGNGLDDTPNAIAVDDATGVVAVVGNTLWDVLNIDDYFIVAIDAAAGTIDWSDTYDGTGNDVDIAHAVGFDPAGAVYMTGRSLSSGQAENIVTLKYSVSGVRLWEASFSGPGSNYDEANGMLIDAGANLYITGTSNDPSTKNDYITLKYDSTGSLNWTARFDGPASDNDAALAIGLDGGGNIYVSGNSKGSGTNGDYSTIKYCQLTTYASNDTAVCLGEDVPLTASGGSNITWQSIAGDVLTVGGNITCTSCANPTFTPTQNTTLIVSSESGSGCVDYDTVEITVMALPTPNIYPSGATTFCPGASITLNTDPAVSWSWSTSETTQSIVVGAAGTYTVTVTDANGCQGSANEVITLFSPPVVTASGGTMCENDSVQMGASGAVTYTWLTDPTLSSMTIPNPWATPSVNTTYTVVGMDANGCRDTTTADVTVNTLPSVSITPDGPTTFCLGDSVGLMSSVGSSYLWSTAETSQDIVVFTAGTYSVELTGANGCTNTASLVVTTNGNPTASITPSGATTFCEGGSVNLTSAPAVFYNWNTGSSSQSITADTSGTYELVVTNGSGCSDTATVNIVVNPVPTSNITASGPLTFCQGDSVVLTSDPADQYTWNTSETTQSITVQSGGFYSLTVTTAAGCSDNSNVVVSVSATPTANIYPGGATSFCAGDSVQLSTDPASAYQWSTGSTSQSTYSTGGVVTLVITAPNGCQDSTDITISTFPLPTVTGVNDSICEGDSVQLQVSGANTYNWYSDPTLSDTLVPGPWANPINTATYTVVGTDINGCMDTTQVVVTVMPNPAPPVITISMDSSSLVSSYPTGNQWVMNGINLAGQTNDTLDLGLFNNQDYSLIYTDLYGCTSESDSVIEVRWVGVGLEEMDIQLMMYPNPATDVLHLEGDLPLLGELMVQVVDSRGRVVRNLTSRDQDHLMIPVGDLAPGSYVLQLIGEKAQVAESFLVR